MKHYVSPDLERKPDPVILKKQRLEYPKKVIFWHLNITSLRNKFFLISELIKGKVDIFLIKESKPDEYFQRNQFSVLLCIYKKR